jgi:PAS domain S-box-containing protein
MPSASTLRVLDGHRVAADRVNDLLEHLSNEQIQAQEEALHRRLLRLLPDLPLVQSITVLDPDGLLLLTANVYPVPHRSYFADREWVRDLKESPVPRTHISKVTIGRLSANMFFGVSRRRVMAERAEASEAYDGVITISVEPNKVAAGFADLVKEPGDKVAIIRSDGEILAHSPGFASPPPPLQATTHPAFFHFVANGAARGAQVSGGFADGDGVIVFRRLPDFPVIARVTREAGAIARGWWQSFRQPLGIGLPMVALVALMAMFAWRRAEELDRVEAAARFHAVFDASPVGMAVVDASSGRMLAANNSLMRLVGVAEQPGAEDFDLRHVLTSESAKSFDELTATVRRGGACEPAELDLVLPGQRRIPIRVSCSALPGDPPRIVLVVQDLSEVRETEARRELMMREVEHRSKNTLALFQSALRLGASGTSDAQELARAVEARITALERSQSLLATVDEHGGAA